MAKKKYYKTIYEVKTWLDIHINHLHYTRNLILTFALASLAFTLNKYEETDTNECRKILLIISAILFGASIFLGFFIALKQSKNYRTYRKISRIIEKTDIADDDSFDEREITPYQMQTDQIEETNKIAFILQMWIFFIGVVIITVSVLV